MCQAGGVYSRAEFASVRCCALYRISAPQVPQVGPWSHAVKPEPIDWDKLLEEVLTRGSAVPEVDWCKPGECDWGAGSNHPAPRVCVACNRQPLTADCCLPTAPSTLGRPPPAAGEDAALKALQGPTGFLSPSRLSLYDTKRNDPATPRALSNLSPYLHFGQLAPQRAALEAAKHRAK
jgi:deoxyribodipyrimidine photo-lyase